MRSLSKGFKGLVLHKASKVWSGNHRTTVWDNNSDNPFCAYCDNYYRIYLPMYKDLNHLRGLSEHECAHIRFTNAKVWKEAIQKVARIAGCSESFTREILNLLEDLRVEILFSKVFKGSALDFEYLLYELKKRYTKKKLISEAQKWSADLFNTIRFGENSNKLWVEVREAIKKQPVFTRVVQGAIKILMSCPYKTETLKFPTGEATVSPVAECKEVKKEWDALSNVLKKVESETKVKKDEIGHEIGEEEEAAKRGKIEDVMDSVKEEMDRISKKAEEEISKTLEKIAKSLEDVDSIKATSRDEKEVLNPIERTSFGEKVNVKIIEPTAYSIESIKEEEIQKRLAKLGLFDPTFLGVEEKLPSKSGKVRISKAISRVAGGRGRFFFRVRKVPGVDVLLLIDQSGSMKNMCSDERSRKDFQAILSAAAFQKSLDRDANIKTAIIGFSAQNGELVVTHFLYKKFDEKFNIKKLCTLIGKGENRDGTSIRFAGKYLLNYGRPDSKKVLVVISDGEPSHGSTGYVGRNAIEDTRKAINEVRAQGIVVLGLGIGIGESRKAAYYMMYGNNVTFMDPSKLTSVMLALSWLIHQLVETA
ncbi:MAG: VWA domain-containing protein [Candidatus Bathyarchaeota archaeon]|nr:VWA domain-containing protein [Candidatus Bathyarchaeota archaeon]